MTKKTTTLEFAPAQVPFLQSDYFIGMCEIATACLMKKEIFVPNKNKGIFNSLFYRRLFAKAETANGGYIVGNFETRNKFLYEYDTVNGVYGEKKEKNIAEFAKVVKELQAGERDFKIFSLQKLETKNASLQELLGL